MARPKSQSNGPKTNNLPPTPYQPRTRWEIEEEAREERWEMRFGPPQRYVPPTPQNASPQLENKQSISVEARYNRAQLLAYLERDDAEVSLDEAISSAEGSKVSLQSLVHGEARFWAVAGDLDRALTKLEEAFELGYRDIYALTDPDFESIRHQPRFLEIAARLEDAANGLAP